VSTVTYTVSARTPAEVEHDLYRLWSENLSPETTPEARFRWLYRDALAPSESVHVLEATEDGHATVVGTNGLVRRGFWVAGQEVRAAVSCDLAVDRRHRALGPALTLVRAVRADVGPRFDLVYGFPNTKAEAVLKRAGFRQIGRARRWAKVLRFTHYLDRLREHPRLPALVRVLATRSGLVRPGAVVADALRGLAMRWSLARLSTKYVIGTTRVADARWNDLWLSARKEYELVGDRSAGYVGWRFKPAPATFYVTLQQRGSSALGAYAVVQLDTTTGAAHVRDVFGHRTMLTPLLDALLPVAWRAGASSVSVRFLGAPDVERHLVALGFVSRDDTRSIVYDAAPALGGHAELLADPSRWHLFDVDEES